MGPCRHAIKDPCFVMSGRSCHPPAVIVVLMPLALVMLLAACGRLAGPVTSVSPASPASPAASPDLDRESALDAAWRSLEPNTYSGDRANWEVVEVRQVTGEEVAEQFEGQVAPGCWQGPTPVPNELVRPTHPYWCVEYRPRPATPVPLQRTISPTEPPAVPEPFMYRALFLVDADTGRVVARKLFCVIY
jgi:hypothetical protein